MAQRRKVTSRRVRPVEVRLAEARRKINKLEAREKIAELQAKMRAMRG